MGNRGLTVWVCLVCAVAFFAGVTQAAFIGEDIGNTTPAGGVTPAGVQPPDPVTITADGGDIWGNADAFHYYHDSWSGNFLATVRFTGIVGGTSGDAWRKMGIMARADTTAGSPHTFVAATPQQVALQWRDSAGASSGWPGTWVTGSPSAASAPFWLSLRRQGTTYTARWAPDVAGSPGVWSTVNAGTDVHVNSGLPSDIEIGLAVTSHSYNNTTIASFDNFSIAPLANPFGRLVPDGSANVRGAAYAEVPPSGPVVGPVSWKLERLALTPGTRLEWFSGNQGWSGTPTYDLTVPNIDWAGNNVSPVDYPPGIPFTSQQDNFSTRYTGYIYAPESRTYTFHDYNDDVCVFTIDGQTLINDGTWTNYWGTANGGGGEGQIYLDEGYYPFEFRQAEGGGGDNARLAWDLGGSLQTIAPEYYYMMGVGELLAEGNSNVGGPLTNGIFANIGDRGGEEMMLRLTVDYQGESVYAYGTFMGVPEPATCFLLAGGLLALARRRRRSR